MSLAQELKYDEKGLIPVIAQDYQNKQVLMLAYANQEAVEKTVTELGWSPYVKETAEYDLQ